MASARQTAMNAPLDVSLCRWRGCHVGCEPAAARRLNAPACAARESTQAPAIDGMDAARLAWRSEGIAGEACEQASSANQRYSTLE